MCKLFFWYFLVLFFLLSCIPHVYSQKLEAADLSAFQIAHYTDEDGLPQNSVYSIAKDEYGYMWLSTERGLARFDGKSFKVFDNFGNTYPAAIIGSFNIDPRPKADGFFAMNSEQNFIHVREGRAASDTVLFSQLSTQPFPYPKKGTGYVLERSPTLFWGNPFPNFFVIPAGNDRFFVCDGEKLAYYERKRKMGTVGWTNKNMWAFFRVDNSLYHFENGTLTRFAAGMSPFKSERVNFKGDLIRDNVFGAGKGALAYWNNAMNQTFIVVGQSLYRITSAADGNLNSELILRGVDFQKEQITAVYYDKEAQRIFLGSQLNGLSVLTREKFFTLAKNFPGTDQVYYGQALMGRDGVLTSQGIAYSIHGADHKIVARQLPLVTDSVFWDKSSLLIDGEGFIWCKHQRRLMMIEPDGYKVRSSWILPSEISQLYQGFDNTIWIQTRSEGIFFLKPPFESSSKPLLFMKGPLSDISWLTEQRGSIIWVGTLHGLYRVVRKTKAVSAVKGLEGIYIRSVYVSPDQEQVWITTYKDGFYLLRGKKLTHFPLDKKGYLANAHCVVEDGRGFLWIPTNRGLFQILKKDLLDYAEKPTELYYHHYSKTDGFNSNEFNGGCQPCAVRLNSGMVSLPSMDGLIWFRPETTTAEVPEKKIMIDRIEIDRKPVPAGQKKVVFSQTQKQLRLQVNTPFFGNANNVEFSYALEEEGKAPTASDWLSVEATTANAAIITISTLGEGHYALHVRKQNGFGRGNYSYETIGIHVPPFWYQTWWFYVLAILTLALSFFIYSKYRIRAIQQRNRLLEMQVGERTNQLQVTLRDLEKSQDELLSQMHLQSRLMASIAHDVRSPLGAAIIISDEMQKMIKREEYGTVLLFATNISDAIRRVKGSLEDMLAYVKIQVYKREPNIEKTDLFDLIEENMQLYGKNTKINSNVFLNMLPAGTFVVTNTQLLKIIVHNLMDNANKFTDSGEIKAYVSRDDNRLRLTIEDSGQGISQDLVEWFMTGTALPAGASHGGIGLAMVRELAPSVTESIRIERLDQGTKVTMTFHRYV